MYMMKRIFVALMAVVLLIGAAGDVQAQNKKKKSGKAKTTQTTKKKKDAAPPAPVVTDIELPYNSNDCLFAIPLQMDQTYGPTTAPDGAGRVQEVVADKAHPNLFEREHNSVWYKITIPYNGQLEINIAQRNIWDDYDFLVYRYTGVYFSNQVLLNKVAPVAVNLGAVDSNALAAAALKASERQPKAKAEAGTKKKKVTEEPEFVMPTEPKPTIGMSVDAKDVMLTKKQFGGFIKSMRHIIVDEEHFVINEAKVRLCHQGMRQDVTGLSVNEKSNVSRRYVKQLRTLIHNWEMNGYEAAQKVFAKHYAETTPKPGVHHIENVISGKLMYLKMVKGETDATYKSLLSRFDRLMSQYLKIKTHTI